MGPPWAPYDTFNLWGPIICNNYMYIYIYMFMMALMGPCGIPSPREPYRTLWDPICPYGGLPELSF